MTELLRQKQQSVLLVLAGFESTRLMRAWEASVGRQAVPMSGDDLRPVVTEFVLKPIKLVELAALHNRLQS